MGGWSALDSAQAERRGASESAAATLVQQGHDSIVGVKVDRIITFGTFDVFHVGHLSILERAAKLGDYLIVGVSTDALNEKKKGRKPVYPQEERIRIVRALGCVNEAFFEESMDEKAAYIRRYRANKLVMGDDWRGRFDEFRDLCEVVYLPRTPSVSTTAVIEKIRI